MVNRAQQIRVEAIDAAAIAHYRFMNLLLGQQVLECGFSLRTHRQFSFGLSRERRVLTLGELFPKITSVCARPAPRQACAWVRAPRPCPIAHIPARGSENDVSGRCGPRYGIPSRPARC